MFYSYGYCLALPSLFTQIGVHANDGSVHPSLMLCFFLQADVACMHDINRVGRAEPTSFGAPLNREGRGAGRSKPLKLDCCCRSTKSV